MYLKSKYVSIGITVMVNPVYFCFTLKIGERLIAFDGPSWEGMTFDFGKGTSHPFWKRKNHVYT